MSIASELARSYADVRAKFFPLPRPAGRYAPEPIPSLLLPPSELAVWRSGWERWTDVRREAHRLAILAIYDEGVQYGRNSIGLVDDSTVDLTIREICRKHTITIAELRGRGRSRILVSARREIAFELRCHLGLSYPQIGKKLGKDHTSILNLMKRTRRSRLLGMRA